jgi:hypothetical protein
MEKRKSISSWPSRWPTSAWSQNTSWKCESDDSTYDLLYNFTFMSKFPLSNAREFFQYEPWFRTSSSCGRLGIYLRNFLSASSWCINFLVTAFLTYFATNRALLTTALLFHRLLTLMLRQTRRICSTDSCSDSGICMFKFRLFSSRSGNAHWMKDFLGAIL